MYFPNGGVCSVTATTKDGAAVEVATVGDEGMLGIGAFWGDGVMATGQTLCQVSDTSAERMSIGAFRREVDRKGAFHEIVGRYSQGALALMIQSTACMALHGVRERCCRWLLMTQDRVDDQFNLSHEFIAICWADASRQSPVVAANLQKDGLIPLHARTITIIFGRSWKRRPANVTRRSGRVRPLSFYLLASTRPPLLTGEIAVRMGRRAALRLKGF